MILTEKTILSTSRLANKRNRSVARRRFGGIDLYAYGEDALEREIQILRSSILAVIGEKGPLAPSLIHHLIEKKMEQQVSKRAFSALLGAELRCGHLDSILCEAESGKPYRIIIEVGRKPNFENLLKRCLDLLPRLDDLAISVVRDRLYPGKEQGNWTRASYLTSRLARIGLVDFVDRFHVRRSKEAYDAISSIDEPLYPSDRFRLD